MNKLVLGMLLGATALTSAAIATQVTAPGAPANAMQKPQKMTPPATREEAAQRADQVFARMDADGDGQVTAAERSALQAERAERRAGRGKGPGPMGKRGGRAADRMLARVDANGDGNISREEHRAQALERFAKVDANGDGRVDAAEQTAVRDQRMQRRERLAERRAARMGTGTDATATPPTPPSPAPMR